jgi:hypothetical protein
MKKWQFILIIWWLPLIANGQEPLQQTRLWQLTSVKGAAKVEGLYRDQTSTTNDLYNYQKSSLIYGGLLMNTSSYVWHPNFLTLDVGGEFNPEKRQEQFLVIPDQAEARTMKKLDFSAAFFKQKAINFSIFGNYNESYNNRENLSNIRSDGSVLGSNFSFYNKIFPIALTYNVSKWKETELQTGRAFVNARKNLQGMFSKSFSAFDHTDITYNHDNFDRIDANLFHVNNISDFLTLNNNINFDLKRKYLLNTNLSHFSQKGNDTFKRTQANEMLSLALLPRLNFAGNYSFIDIGRESQSLKQHTFSAGLKHQLYESLNSSIIYEFNNVNHTFYHEINNKEGVDIRYDKILPGSGRLSLSYNFSNLNQKRISESQMIQVINEEHTLRDGEMVLLGKPYIEGASVVVKDITGAIIFQQGFDYVLVDRNNFKEIQRMPGGQIADNSHVFIDYLSIQPGSYQYDATFNQFAVNLMFFNRLIEVYYRTSKQNYHNLETADYLTLNYFKQNLVGARFEYKFLNGGVEIDNYASSVVPYLLVRYFFQVQGNFRNKILYSLNSNLRDYKKIDTERNQQYADLSANVAYQLTQKSRVTLELGYRKQTGRQIDLNLLTARTEFTTSYRELLFKVGIELYRRTYLNEKVNFNGAYFRIIRNFSWNKK